MHQVGRRQARADADFDLFQADKGLFSAILSTRPGGEIILLSPCYEGVSPSHPECVDLGAFEDDELEALARDPASGRDPLSIAEMMYLNTATRHGKVTVVSEGITPEVAAKLGFGHVAPEAFPAYLARIMRDGKRLGIIHHSAETLPLIEE